MVEPIVQTISYEDEDRHPIRGPLGKSWKLLASVNLFILSLKSKWRRRRRGKLAGQTGGFVLGAGAIYEAVPRLLVNNWTMGQAHTGQCISSRSPSPRGSAVGGGLHLSGDSSRPSTGSSSGFSRRLTTFVGMHGHNSGGRRMSVRNVWQNLTLRGRSDSTERRSSAGLGMIDARVSGRFVCFSLSFLKCLSGDLLFRRVIIGRSRSLANWHSVLGKTPRLAANFMATSEKSHSPK